MRPERRVVKDRLKLLGRSPGFLPGAEAAFRWATGFSPMSIAVFAESTERKPPAQKKTKRLSCAKTGL